MFNIILIASKSYIKYAAVLMNSIILNTDKSKNFKDFFTQDLPCMKNDGVKNVGGGGANKDRLINLDSKQDLSLLHYNTLDYDKLSQEEKQEGYIFHILTSKDEFIDSDTISNIESKLSQLQENLNDIYPCSIKIHYISDSYFKNCPTLNGNYSTYYRLLVADLLDSKTNSALYLDCDMLVAGDLRGLFSIDLGNNFVYVVRDYALNSRKKIEHISDKNKFLEYNSDYFNAGFLLLNLESCRKINLWKKSQNIFNNYAIELHDQDTLNYIFKNNVGILSPCFNLLIVSFGNWAINISSDEGSNYDVNYRRDIINRANENIVIYHYTIYKPWQSALRTKFSSAFDYPRVFEIIKLWRECARNTPVFKSELVNLLDSIHKDEVENYPLLYVTKRFDNIEKDYKERLQVINKKLRKKISILIFGEIFLLVFILLVLIFK